MANSSSHAISEIVMGGLVSMAEVMSPELRNIFLDHLDDYQSTDADSPTDPRRILRKFISLNAQDCPSRIRRALGMAIIKDHNPVDIFFGRLPSPEDYEKDDNPNIDGPRISDKHDDAFNIFKYYTLVQGRASMRARHGDTILEQLFELLDREDCPSLGNPGRFEKRRKFCEILAVVCHVGHGTAIQQLRSRYTEPTCRKIEYLRWVARGRKDSECTVEKQWVNNDFTELRWSGHHELSCLPLGRLSSQGSREEEQRLDRLAQLFQVAFIQFLLSDPVRYNSFHTVQEADGIVRATINTLDGNSETRNAGVAADGDPTRPELKAALCAYRCGDIRGPARALLEYFFRPSCAKISFLDFLPRNANTPVALVMGRPPTFRGHSLFNMDSKHQVAILETESGLEFVLDPTAAQYGWSENIAPRDTYTRYRVDLAYEGTDSDETRDPSAQLTGLVSEPEEIWKSVCVAEHVVQLVRDFLRATGGLDGVVQLPQAQFDQHSRALENFLSSCMEEYTKSGFF